jgi:hypothetical protein
MTSQIYRTLDCIKTNHKTNEVLEYLVRVAEIRGVGVAVWLCFQV